MKIRKSDWPAILARKGHDKVEAIAATYGVSKYAIYAVFYRAKTDRLRRPVPRTMSQDTLKIVPAFIHSVEHIKPPPVRSIPPVDKPLLMRGRSKPHYAPLKFARSHGSSPS